MYTLINIQKRYYNSDDQNVPTISVNNLKTSAIVKKNHISLHNLQCALRNLCFTRPTAKDLTRPLFMMQGSIVLCEFRRTQLCTIEIHEGTKT